MKHITHYGLHLSRGVSRFGLRGIEAHGEDAILQNVALEGSNVFKNVTLYTASRRLLRASLLLSPRSTVKTGVLPPCASAPFFSPFIRLPIRVNTPCLGIFTPCLGIFTPCLGIFAACLAVRTSAFSTKFVPLSNSIFQSKLSPCPSYISTIFTTNA